MYEKILRQVENFAFFLGGNDCILNGRNITVTEESKEKYVNLVCHSRMMSSMQKQIKAYLDSSCEMVKSELILMFIVKEVKLLTSGLPNIDILNLQRNTEYKRHKVLDREIIWFSNIVFLLSRSEKAAFIQFVTRSSKVYFAGFSQL